MDAQHGTLPLGFTLQVFQLSDVVHYSFFRLCATKLTDAIFQSMEQTALLGVLSEARHNVRKIRGGFYVLLKSIMVKLEFFVAALGAVFHREDTVSHIFSLDVFVRGTVFAAKGFEQASPHNSVKVV